jgi:hypothetical protein
MSVPPQGLLSPELLAILGTALLLVLTVYGTLIKFLYDRNRSLDHTVNGTNGSDGFISQQQETNQELMRSQREIARSMRAHGALLQELVYVMQDVSSALDDEDLQDVDMRRIDYLEQTLQNSDGFPTAEDEYSFDSEAAAESTDE